MIYKWWVFHIHFNLLEDIPVYPKKHIFKKKKHSQLGHPVGRETGKLVIQEPLEPPISCVSSHSIEGYQGTLGDLRSLWFPHLFSTQMQNQPSWTRLCPAKFQHVVVFFPAYDMHIVDTMFHIWHGRGLICTCTQEWHHVTEHIWCRWKHIFLASSSCWGLQ